jgi:hypothetical protein
MYIIINKTKQTAYKHEGSFPDLDEQLEKGDRIIIISKYSNTIKVPYFNEYNGIKEWEWENFPLDKHILTEFNKNVSQIN